MQFVFSNVSADDLHSRHSAEILAHVEADFSITDGERLIFTEHLFPVAELAVELLNWRSGPEGVPFEMQSGGFSDDGAVRIHRRQEGWCVGSVFHPDVWTTALPLTIIDQRIRTFVADVKTACLVELQIDIASVLPLAGSDEFESYRGSGRQSE
ncbi:hypothetical protein [Nonomuraea sp. NPDC005650]|uniref:DUF7878 domain-containing protein n=1 Tax=Nonomuraea sp. NPDC005650 TaxID=3157045 RepID=UPI0033A364F1